MYSKKQIVLLSIFFFVSIVMFAEKDYSKLSLPADTVVAKVNGIPITAKSLDIEASIAFTLLSIKQTNSNFYEILLGTEEGYDFLVKYKTIVLYKLIDSYVLLEIAKSFGIDYDTNSLIDYVNTFVNDVLTSNQLTDKEFENYIVTQGYNSLTDYKEHLAFQRRVTLSNVQLMDKLITGVALTETEIDEYMKTHPSTEDQNISVHLSHILLEKTDNANQVLSTIQKDGFEQAVLLYSRDELTKTSGGDLGWLQKGAFPQFDVAFNAKPGEILGPIQTQLGFHIIRINNFSGGTYGQSVYREEVRMQLSLEKKVVLWEKWLTEEFPKIKQNYTIDISF